ncbi:MAG: low molecular weight protein arginine phosphatase [Candidatus Zixiibacteriota bacterium]|nr:MAG: low molecular weight protein arginine phosphatase [candidate division Zixibacteria bacterium]
MKNIVRGKFKVLFVCTGNTCRSPMAEGVLKKMLEDRGVGNIEVSSAGTHGLPNAPASLFAMEVAGDRNVDLSGHRSRRLTSEMIKGADLILAMSPEHLDYIKRIEGTAGRKTFLLKAFPQPDSASNKGPDGGVLSIEDPIGGSPEDYERSFSEIEKEIKRIFPEILGLAEEDDHRDTSRS